jgi:hypothetical protein
MNKFVLLALACLMTSCTYNISMVHTEGTASDVIDETSANTPTVSPTISIPAVKA